MPDDNTTTTTNTATLTAGITFEIGSTTIDGCMSTPDFIFSREKVDVTTFDDDTYKAYIGGLQDTNELNFDFIDYGTNYTAANTGTQTPGTTYTVTFPSSHTITITGDHVVGPLAAAPNEPLKFRVSITATDITIA